MVSNIEGVASDNSQYLRSWEWRELRLWSPRPWEEGSVDRMLVNHHKCYFGDVPYTMWLSFYYKKSAQLRTENYCTKIPYVHSHASVTTSFIPGNLSPALQPSVLYYVSRGCWRGYSVISVGVLVEKGVVLFIGVLEPLFDHFWRSVGQSPLYEAERAHRHNCSNWVQWQTRICLQF